MTVTSTKRFVCSLTRIVAETISLVTATTVIVVAGIHIDVTIQVVTILVL